jgi:DNA-binding NarL/FixJ family response regulator
MGRTTVLLADDHAIVAEGLSRLLGRRFELVGTVGDGFALVDAAKSMQPDVIVADIDMPGLTGLEAVRRLAAEGHSVRVVFLTMHADPDLAAEALRVGATGFVLKHAAGEELIAAIEHVLEGRFYVTPRIAKEALAALAAPRPAAPLTPRQLDVLRLLAEGLRVKQIAAKLDLSPRTVETHKYDMMEALGVQTTAELLRHAIRIGLIEA